MLRNKPVEFYLGNINACFYGCSSSAQLRDGAASGGMVTQLLYDLLKNSHIDAAYVSRLRTVNGEFSVERRFVRDADILRDFQSSIYMDFPFREARAEIEKFTGKAAIVGLPCHLAGIKNKNIVKIGLFCGHSSQRTLIEKILKSKYDLKKISSFCFRNGHWRGKSRIKLNDGSVHEIPYFNFGVYQNIFFNIPPKCLFCADHCAENSDISMGDLWLRKFKKQSLKYTCIISRKQWITDLLLEMCRNNAAMIGRIDPQDIIRAQKRPLIFHKFVTRAIKEIRYGKRTERLNWNDYFSARIILFNKGLSEKSYSRLFFMVPWQIIFLYMVLVRFFLSF